MSAEFLDFILEVVISYLVPILELIGVFIVAYGTIKSFIKFIRSGLNSDDTRVKIDLADTLALSLEFKMAGEILKTVVSHTIEELSILGAVIVLRALLTFLIHWELKMERQTEHAEREHAKAPLASFEARRAFSNLLACHFYINLSIIWAVLILQHNYCLYMIKLHQLKFILFFICVII